MSRWESFAAIVAMWAIFLACTALLIMLVASVTVIPMYRNWQDHGSIFVAPERKP